MANGLHSQIDIEIRPVKMVGMRMFDVCQLRYRRVFEPRKLGKRHEEFFVTKHEPKTVLGDVGYFNFQSADARRHGRFPRVFVSTLQRISLPFGQAVILRQFYPWLRPEFGLAVSTIGVHMQSRLLAREEKESEARFAKNRRTQCSVAIEFNF
jgi:hypothetical protein